MLAQHQRGERERERRLEQLGLAGLGDAARDSPAYQAKKPRNIENSET